MSSSSARASLSPSFVSPWASIIYATSSPYIWVGGSPVSFALVGVVLRSAFPRDAEDRLRAAEDAAFGAAENGAVEVVAAVATTIGADVTEGTADDATTKGTADVDGPALAFDGRLGAGGGNGGMW
jgi:hypothetical protein